MNAQHPKLSMYFLEPYITVFTLEEIPVVLSAVTHWRANTSSVHLPAQFKTVMIDMLADGES